MTFGARGLFETLGLCAGVFDGVADNEKPGVNVTDAVMLGLGLTSGLQSGACM